MRFCKKCGKELVEGAVFCPECGAAVEAQAAESVVEPAAEPVAPVAPQNTFEKPQTPADGKSFGFAFLGFCIPLVGLILWLVWKDSTPLKAKSCGKGALVGVIVSVVFYIIYAVFLGFMMASY